MNKLKLAWVLAISGTAVLAGLPAAIAQQAPVPVAQQSTEAVAKPAHGQSMESVESAFGEPVQRYPAVGEPPITRWQYASFTVYFENDKVIHSVAHRS